MDEEDIVWLHGSPAVVAIHYHLRLSSTHVLYCLDDHVDHEQVHVRELGRSVLTVVDSASYLRRSFETDRYLL